MAARYKVVIVTWLGITSTLPYSMLHLLSWDRLMNTSQVSRANGTTHTHSLIYSAEEGGASLSW